MLLRNFDHLLTAHTISKQHYGTSVSISSDGKYLTVQTTSGSNLQNIPIGQSNSIYGMTIMSFYEKSICVGDGTQSVQYDDYRLSGSRTEGTFSLVSNSIEYDEENKEWVRTLTVKCTNNQDTDFVVSEWGIWRWGDTNSSNTVFNNSSNYCILVWRELLEEPVTIAANSTATLTFTLKVPHEVNAF